MTIRTTLWSPDTCTCQVSYTWDDTISEATRTHSFASAVRKCSAHNAQTDANCYTTLMDENPRKNIALQVCLDNGPSTLYDLSGTTRTLKSTITYNYSWSGTAPNRLLTISFIGISLTTTQKSTIQTAINTRLGSGKVTIV